MGYLLDTDICGFYLRGMFSINEKIKAVGIDKCFVSEITILELIYGARMSSNYEKHLKDVQAIKGVIEVIPIEEAYDRSAWEKVRLKREGTLIPDFDLLIVSTALARELKMVTNNEKHLRRLQDIEIENWTKQKYNKFIGED